MSKAKIGQLEAALQEQTKLQTGALHCCRLVHYTAIVDSRELCRELSD